MPKDLIAVGQRGMAIVDRDNPLGLCTYDLQTCAALFLVGENDKIGLLHIDNGTSGESIEKAIKDNFPRIIRYKYIANPNYADVGATQMDEILAKVYPALGNPDTFVDHVIQSTNGTFIAEKIPGKGFRIDANKTLSELQERNIYDRDFENYRRSIHYINRMFGIEFPIDLQYDARTFTKLPKILVPGLEDDLDLLESKSPDHIRDWIVSPETIAKYPGLAPLLTTKADHVNSFVRNITDHFSFKEACVLTEYRIPLIADDTDQEDRIITAVSSMRRFIGEEAEFKKRRDTDWTQCYDVKLKSDLLVKEIRDLIGLDKRRIPKLSEAQEESLRIAFPHIVIEADKSDTSKNLITFPKGEENVKFINGVINPSTAPVASSSSAQPLRSAIVVATSK